MINKENLVMKATNLVWAAFLIGGCAIVTSFLFVFLLLNVKLSFLTLPFYLIAFLLFGPTLSAIFETVFQCIIGGKGNVIKSYFRIYKEGFISSIKVWLPYFLLTVILFGDLYYIGFSKQTAYALPLIYILIIVMIISYVYSLVLHTKFIMKIRDILKFSLYLTINRPITSLTIIFFVLAVYLFFRFASSLAIFGALPLFAFVTLYSMRKMLGAIEAKFVNAA
ncbi:hypothetical protein AN964_04550 [Heyndrickxia shackletonii]|uniref:DUF624 domain-containing protein n=1 Tax=Heyndrickxia shackletonii TaxID=157838 RepID=A0A0Q3WWB5_9BACI|nr:DUF624 domain-containing protein [Heyndrickxia shackletonii]KQL52858.1 hypothetical protein AN964_04550 [Heyndrickxia shackletonii]MBB2480707.1 DUF624 domain-containing protein [Bacillus sp. APMAM]NEZ00375.1 DUF624 domain-containing protein [Heyndrickxia shackletonii]RTZ55955.1 DUF624 domain-containing protein [Bacillus sp. SAJ1]